MHILRPLAAPFASSPIEVIVAFSVVGTLAYFQVLHNIKHSSFFVAQAPLALRPAHAVLRDGTWLSVGQDYWSEARKSSRVELQGIVFGLEDAQSDWDYASIFSSPLSDSLSNITSHLVSIAPQGTLLPSTGPQDASTAVTTLTFLPGSSRGEFVTRLQSIPTTQDEWGVSYRVEGRKTQAIREMRSGKWVAYAASALLLRFWELAKKADSVDILLVLVGYILMHITFLRLFLSARVLGVQFTLTLGILASAILSFMITLPIAPLFRIPLDPVALTEALPFLVCTVGFDKPLRLARAVFGHPALLPSTNSASSSAPSKSRIVPASTIVTDALAEVGIPILRDYLLEIALLLIGAASRVGGLREFCALAALSMSVDAILMVTFYVAILSIMVEVRRIKAVRKVEKEKRANAPTNGGIIKASRSSSPVHGDGEVKLKKSLSATLLGVKGPMTITPIASTPNASVTRSSSPEPRTSESSPVARLKLLLIASFLTLHILNFTGVLTPGGTTASRLWDDEPARKVDISTPTIAQALNELAAAHAPFLASGVNLTTERRELLVKIAPPIYVRMLPPGSQFTSSSGIAGVSALERFMTAWTRLVGDPVISKWIVLVLGASVALNGYLLRGIAANIASGARPSNVRFLSGIDAPQRPKKMDNEEAEMVNATESSSRTLKVPEHHDHREGNSIEKKSKDMVSQLDPTVQAQSRWTAPKPSSPPAPVIAAPVPRAATSSIFMLEKLDAKLSAQADNSSSSSLESSPEGSPKKQTISGIAPRPLEDLIDIFENGPRPVSASLALLTDEEVITLAQTGKIAAYALEKVLEDLERAVRIRRALVSRASKTQTLETSLVPFESYDYSKVMGACCENVVGYIPLPLGIAGPLRVDGEVTPIPMATAEGTLVASTSRGCKALNAGGGVTTVLTNDGMTRGPAIDFPSIVVAGQAKAWLDSESGYATVKAAFESTSRFAKLQKLKTAMAGRTLFVRFSTTTGDAMGMNMISKGTEKALEVMQNRYPDMVVLALSGNYCTDKKPAAINWIEGRGKSIVAEAVIPGKIVKSVLKTTVDALCNLNIKKNLVGSAMAGSIGGFNAHAANILTAVFLATGQDPAQNVESSQCMTLMEPTNGGEDLLMTVSMPCIEVGTVGGGTVLTPQQGVLDLLGLRGAHPSSPGENAQRLARIIAAAVMAGELSLMSALAAGHLVRAHLVHNRSQTNTPATSRPVTPAPRLTPLPASGPPPYEEEKR